MMSLKMISCKFVLVNAKNMNLSFNKTKHKFETF